jgi:hypothetical protein
VSVFRCQDEDEDETEEAYRSFCARYKECIRMLNGLEKRLESKLPQKERRWQIAEEVSEYGVDT